MAQDGREKHWVLFREGLPTDRDTAGMVGAIVCTLCNTTRATGIWFPKHQLALCDGCYDKTTEEYKAKLGGPPSIEKA